MSRQLRPNLPGVPFHLTARLQNRERLFEGLEREVVAFILGTARVGRVSVMAYAVMSNHLHVLVVQGDRPLARYMQPLLRSTALLVMRHWRREGHMFERRYHSSPCLDADYLRNAIAYIHLNPVRAEVCADPLEYEWTSHRHFDGGADHLPLDHQLATAEALRLFGEHPEDDAACCRDSYHRFLSTRLLIDEHAHTGGTCIGPALPVCEAGDAWWNVRFARGAATAAAAGALLHTPRLQLRDIAEQVLADYAPHMGLAMLRSGGRMRALVRVRRIVIARALQAGFMNRQVARFLDVSTTTVSAAAADLLTPQH